MDREDLERIRQARQYYNDVVAEVLKKYPREKQYRTASGIEVDHIYTPADIAETDYLRDIGFPGQYPFTRGLHPLGFRSREWTRRPVVGIGTAEETNERLRYLVSQGMTGFAVVGLGLWRKWDSDDERSIGFLGRTHIHVDTLADFETLFAGIDLEEVSFTQIGPYVPAFASYLALAERRGLDKNRLRGTIQNMYIPGTSFAKESIDIVEYCSRHMPRWNHSSIHVRNTREGGCTAPQEAAFGLANGIAMIEACLERGLEIDEFAPRISWMLSAHNELFEEVAKFRAMRRMWARLLKERYGARDTRSCMLRYHVQTSGDALTARQPLNNIVRGTIHGLAAALGGAQSIHICSFDEALATPTKAAAVLSLRTQQIIQYESGVTATVDPLGGAYYVEWLTNKVEEEAQGILDAIERQGGLARADGWIAEQIHEAAWKYQEQIEKNERVIVGVNKFTMDDEDELDLAPAEIMEYDPAVRDKQIARLNRVRRERDQAKVEEAKKMLFEAYRSGMNIIPHMIEAVKTYITYGELDTVRAEALGPETWREGGGLDTGLGTALYGT